MQGGGQGGAGASAIVDAHPDAARWRAAGAAMTRDEILDFCLERLSPSP